MTNSDKHNNLSLRMCKWIIQWIKLKAQKEPNSDIKKDKLVEFRRIVCWMSGKHY